MRATYAVTWRETDGEAATGRLELDDNGLRLDGVAGQRHVHVDLPYVDLVDVSVGRSADERVEGRQTLVVVRRHGKALRIAGVAHQLIISELAEHLASVKEQRARPDLLVVVVPLKEGARDDVRRLLAAGPPFDLEDAGLERHSVFLADRQVVFLFEARSGAALEQLFEDAQLWAAAAGWEEYIAGPPSIAEGEFSWERSRDARNGVAHGLGL